MKRIIRFLLRYGHLVEANVTPAEAVDLARDWESGAWQLAKDRPRRGGTDLMGRRWSVLVEEIIGVVAFDFVEPPQQQPPPGYDPRVRFPTNSN